MVQLTWKNDEMIGLYCSHFFQDYGTIPCLSFLVSRAAAIRLPLLGVNLSTLSINNVQVQLSVNDYVVLYASLFDSRG